MSDYQRAMHQWQSGRNTPGEEMPEAFRIRPAFRQPPEHAAAIERIRAWTRERFGLGASAAVLVAEIACGLPGCPPLETVVAFWTGADARHQFKIFKRAADVTPDDMPPAFLKNSLVVDEEAEFDCC